MAGAVEWDMQSKAATVDQYLAELPAERREALQVLRRVFLENVDSDIEEGMTYGMIGYYIPHRVFPAGYHCDPKMPVGYGGLASQKQYMSLYLMTVYGEGADGGPENEHGRWFKQAWLKTGKKLDMGKCCVRFKRIEDVALDVVAECIRRVPSKVYLESYVRALEQNKVAAAARAAARKVGSAVAAATSGDAGGKGGTGSASTKSAARSPSKPAGRKVGSLGTVGGAPGAKSAGMGGVGGGASAGAKFGGAGQMPVKQSGPSKGLSQRAGPSQIRKAPRSRSR